MNVTEIPEPDDYAARVYAGVLGKLIGVYLGRPVEGWPYRDIESRFGEVAYYVNDKLGIPLVVADDDISGSFAFSRAVLDHRPEPGRAITARQVGETWLNYIIEDKTILWWGGLGRSTEHTAYLRLKNGMHAPDSGSIATNGPTLPVQVGAQIFIDGFAMMHPGNPINAAEAVRAAASVSHDDIALDAAAFIGAMEAAAFTEPSMLELIRTCRSVVSSPLLNTVIDDVIDACATESDWRIVRDFLHGRYGYEKFVGPCSVVTNHAMVLASLLLGGDDFQRSVMIASSAGWDTDSNAGVVGCLNGIRLGLDALSAQVDFRGPVADQLYVVTADGGECVSDAVLETRKIVSASRILYNRTDSAKKPRFGFDFPDSVQGFQSCPVQTSPYPSVTVGNRFDASSGTGALALHCTAVGAGIAAAVSTPTFVLRPVDGVNFSTLASPTLYAAQTVRAQIRLASRAPTDAVGVRLYVVREHAGHFVSDFSELFALGSNARVVEWTVPTKSDNPILRFGFQVESTRRFDGDVLVDHVDWSGAPSELAQRGVVMTSIWDLTPEPLRAWVSSAKNFEADFRYTYSVSHPSGTGVVTSGTRDWDDYSYESTLVFNPHLAGGLVVRSSGHRRYYAAVFSGWNTVSLIRQDHESRVVLAETPYVYVEDIPMLVRLEATGDELILHVDGRELLRFQDSGREAFRAGSAGFLVTEGTMLADGFAIASTTRSPVAFSAR